MFIRFLKYFLPSALVLTLACGLVYVVAQQMLRQAANDPQLQMARDMALALQNGRLQPDDYHTDELLDIRNSLYPFEMIFDDQNNLLVSTGQLDGEPLSVPAGVLDYAEQHGEHLVTLQPTPKVRLAAVLKSVGLDQPGLRQDTVLVARNLSVTEDRIQQMSYIVLATWLGGLVMLVLWSFLRLHWKAKGM